MPLPSRFFCTEQCPSLNEAPDMFPNEPDHVHANQYSMKIEEGRLGGLSDANVVSGSTVV